jgi:hypothetical protein
MPRLQHNWGVDQMSTGYDREHSERNPIDPERTQFLNERQHYDGTDYEKPDDRSAYSNGHALFNDDDYSLAMSSEQREPGSSYNASRYIDTSESQNRLREAGERRSLEGKVRFSLEGEREGIEGRQSANTPSVYGENSGVPETVWRDFISPGKSIVR